MTAVGLVTLRLVMIHPSTYFHPNTLLQWISLVPHLETLYVLHSQPRSREAIHACAEPIIAPVTLPNLHHFWFHSVSTYLEHLFIGSPPLGLRSFKLNSSTNSHFLSLLRLMNTTENLRFHSAYLMFHEDHVMAAVYSHGYSGVADMYAFEIRVFCWHLDWQVSSMAQIFNFSSSVAHFERAHNQSIAQPHTTEIERVGRSRAQDGTGVRCRFYIIVDPSASCADKIIASFIPHAASAHVVTSLFK